MVGYLRSILQLSSTHAGFSLLLGEVQQLEIPPVMERTRTITGQDQEHRGTSHRDEVEREQDDELEDLPKRKWRIDGTGCRSAEAAGWVAGLGVDNSRGEHKLFLTFIYQNGIENIHQRLVHEEGLEQGSNYSGALAENQEGAVDPCSDTLEDGQEGHLR